MGGGAKYVQINSKSTNTFIYKEKIKEKVKKK